ncbi:MAG: ETC complex I subunit [Micavibrio sp.]
MKTVRIYRPSKNTMQSGLARTKRWVLEYEAETPRMPEPLMGWTASGDTANQVRLQFDTAEQAVSYAQAKGWAYSLAPAHDRIIRPRNYADNFRYIPPQDNATS